MIKNDKWGFIFVHIQKTAGSSITDSLSKLEGNKRIGYYHSFMRNNEISNINSYFKFFILFFDSKHIFNIK
jgi:hypothetical protein